MGGTGTTAVCACAAAEPPCVCAAGLCTSSQSRENNANAIVISPNVRTNLFLPDWSGQVWIPIEVAVDTTASPELVGQVLTLELSATGDAGSTAAFDNVRVSYPPTTNTTTPTPTTSNFRT